MQSSTVALVAGALVFTSPLTASAYCRTYTCEFDGRQICEVDPETGCGSGGELARWDGSCISFAVQVDGSEDEDISAETLRLLVSAGFRSWSDGDCDGAGPSALTPSLTATYRGETTCDQVEYNCGEQNDNIVMFRDEASSLTANTIALSTIIANLRTGEILDVDIEINSQDFDFYVSPAEPRPGAQDLRLVLNHELGHMLGLSHSLDSEALMRAEYGGRNPLPAQDDLDGMCSVFAMSEEDPRCPVEALAGEGACVGSDGVCPAEVASKRQGCSFGGGQMTGWSGFVMGVGLGLCALLRRRRIPLGSPAARSSPRG